MDISPAPTDEETAAIMAGMEALWPKPAVALDDGGPRATKWRFSGRWWNGPLPRARQRP